MKREMSVAGAFYPDGADEILRYFEHFNSIIDENKIDIPSSKAVIVPHAGYVYSGFSANIAYRVLKNSNIKKFVVIGPSHRVGFKGTSLCEYDLYKTPFGDIKSASDIVKELKEKFSLETYPQAHMEHSTEVQFPFLKHYIEDVQIVELVYSSEDPERLSKVIDYVLSQKEWGVIISTDLSHFYIQADANALDSICVEAVKNIDILRLHNGCEACGIIGMEAMLMSAKDLVLNLRY